MVNLSRRGFARLAVGPMKHLAQAVQSYPDAITELSGSSLTISQPSSSASQGPAANPLSEEPRWNRNGFRPARSGNKLRMPPE
jgi:hypothetical protein